MNLPFIAVLMSLGISTSLCSQENPSEDSDATIKEQPLIVVSNDENSLPVPLQEEVTAVNNTSGGANLVDQSAWDDGKATQIKDLLDFIPGVFVQQRNGAESARISIRGSGLGRQFQGGGLLLRYDGIPLNTADGSFDFQAIDPWLIDYVTVYRGANGLAQGGSTLGGVINFGTTDPNADESSLLRLASGSFATRQGLASFTTQVSEESAHTFRLRASHFQQEGFRVQNQQNSNRFDVQHAYHLSPNTTHKSSFYHLNTYAELPSSLSKALLYDDPKQSRGFNINGHFHRDLTLSRLAYQMHHTTPQEAEFKLAMFYSAKKLINPVFTFINRDSKDVGLNLSWFKGSHAIHLYTQLGNQDEIRRENEAGLPGAMRLARDQDAMTTSLSYQWQQAVMIDRFGDRLIATVAAQGIFAQRDITEISPNSISSDRSYQQINPRLGLIYQANNNIQLFGNFSHSFEPPTFAELNNGNQAGINTPIRAQSAHTLEIGSRGTTGTLVWDVAAYYSQLDNEFIRFRFPDGATRNTNAKNSIHLGLEAGLSWQLTDQLTWTTSYQWTNFKLKDDVNFANNKIPGIPEHYLQSQLTFQHPSGWKINPSIEWVPTAYYIDLANTYRSDNYLLTGLTLAYTSSEGFEFYLDVKNLNDQTYISTSLPIPGAGGTDGNYFYSGEGRAFYAGVKWQF